MKKKMLKVIIVVLIVASVLGNVYFFGWKKIEQKIYQRGVNDAVLSVSNQVKNSGQIILPSFTLNEKGEWIQDGQIILVPQISETIEEMEFE